MFGYIQPYKEELKVKDVKAYQNIYCAVCNALKRRYGMMYSMLLNYEVVFLYFYLQGAVVQDKSDYEITCMINPLRKTSCRINHELLNYAAFINVYLVQGKLKDNYNDEHSLMSKSLYYLLDISENYRQDCKKYSELISKIDFWLNKLTDLEKSENVDIDDCSETMGQVLKEIVSFYFDFYKLQTKSKTEIEEIAYILGQWIYIIDAYDDYEKDKKSNSFNPFIKQNIANYKITGLKILNLMNWNMQRIKNNINFADCNEIVNNIFQFGLQNKVNEIRQKENITLYKKIKGMLKKWMAYT